MKHRSIAKRGSLCALTAIACAGTARAAEVWQADLGRTTLTFDVARLQLSGVSVVTSNSDATISLDQGGSGAIFLLEQGSSLMIAARDGVPTDFLGGELLHKGELSLKGPSGTVQWRDFILAASDGTEAAPFIAAESFNDPHGLLIDMVKSGIDPVSGMFVLYGNEVRLTPEAAATLGDPALAADSIGTILVETRAQWVDGDLPTVQATAVALDETDDGGPRGGQDCDAGESPDVIVGDLHEVARYGNVGGITAYSVGTVSCNSGTCWLNWFQNTNQHPVIPQNMFRLKTVGGATRFEQIGQSWLKHGFFALSQGLCFSDCQGTDGTHLGIHCSDPYSASLNGQQSNLGPRSQVNAATGFFPYPFSAPPPPPTIGRRLQVHDTDLDSAQNAGATYFVEGHYVTPDDAAAGNDNNNASYRRITVGGAPNFNISLAGTTRRERAGIRAWKENGLGVGVPDPDVQERDIQVPSDGLFILAAKATNLGNGFHRFEYALQNLNSHRSGQAFSVPFPPGTIIQNAGFHDVDSHSGEPYSLTDWAVNVGPSSITWSTETFAQNQNANALRWGTLYNFRFDANATPEQNTVTLTLFRSGTPDSVTATVVAPPSGPPDCNFNGIGDPTDIAAGTSQDCNNNNIPDECDIEEDRSRDCNNDGIPDECQLADNDCNINSTPDDCEPDCNNNGTADGCDIFGGASTDCDLNGVPDDCQADCDDDGTPDTCEQGVVLFEDNFETDKGWTVASDAPVVGMWERADPQQTVLNTLVVQPEFDNPNGTGTLCYVTDGRGPITSAYDVDNGPTRLVSPTMDLSAGAATISYAYWFHTQNGTGDSMTLQVSNDDGANWVTMYTHNSSASLWRSYSDSVDAFIARTSTMKFRFVISDMGNDSFTEGLIDDVIVSTPDCPSTCSPPAAMVTGACSAKTGSCCLPIGGAVPGEGSEPRAGGIEEVRLTFDQSLCSQSFALGGGGVSIQETTTALYPAWQAWSGGSIVSSSGSGNELVLTFSPPLANAAAYRIHLGSGVTSVAQSIDIRGLVGDVNSDGIVDALDRSVVVGVWTGGGYTCPTDVSITGTTDALDRSVVVGAWTGGTNTAP